MRLRCFLPLARIEKTPPQYDTIGGGLCYS